MNGLKCNVMLLQLWHCFFTTFGSSYCCEGWQPLMTCGYITSEQHSTFWLFFRKAVLMAFLQHKGLKTLLDTDEKRLLVDLRKESAVHVNPSKPEASQA